MKRLIITLILLCLSQLLFSQEKDTILTIDFHNVNRKKILEKIESVSDYQFYFEENWLNNEDLINLSFQKKSVPQILKEILKETDINFFVNGKKIILTQNIAIFEDFPILSNKEINQLHSTASQNPFFYKENDLKTKSNEKATNKIILVGKEDPKAIIKHYSIRGYIKDLKNNNPLSNIVINIKNTLINTTTDANGKFELTLPAGTNVIETKSLVYKNITRILQIYSDGRLDLFLEENINQLDEVIVKGQGSQNIKNAITGVTTIVPEDIKTIPLILGERDVLKIALTIPGIKSAGEGSSGFNVRGGKEDQNLILLDKATIYNPTHFFGFFSSINPYTVNKIDIYKGAIPVKFGGRLSSVFDIESKNGNQDDISGEAGIGPVTSNATVSLPIIKGKSSLLIGGRATYTDWILKSLKDESLKNSKASFYDLFTKYNYQINNNNIIKATAYYSKDNYKISSDSTYKYSNKLLSFIWEHKLDDKNDLEFYITNSEYKFNINYDSENLNSFESDYKIGETQISFKLENNYSNKHKFNYGLSSKLYNINPGELKPKEINSLLNSINIPREKGLESAVFVADNYKINNKILFDIGIRYSLYSALGNSKQKIYEENQPKNDFTVIGEKQYSKNEPIKFTGNFEPRLGIRYLFNENLSIKLRYDNSIQNIHLLTNNTTQTPTDTWKLSNLNIKPQRGEQISAGIFKRIDYKKLEFSLEGYYKKSKNILDYKVGANLSLNQNLETEILQGAGKSYGIEFLLKKTEGRLNGWIGYTYSRAFIKLDSPFNSEKINNGSYFPTNYDKPHDFTSILNYKLTKRYSFSSNITYQTGRPITYPIGKYNYGGSQYTLYSDRNKFRIPDYYRLDIGINIEGSHKIKKTVHSFWNISIYNLLGRNNPYSVYFVTNEGKIKAYQTSIFSTPIPTITYNFKF